MGNRAKVLSFKTVIFDTFFANIEHKTEMCFYFVLDTLSIV